MATMTITQTQTQTQSATQGAAITLRGSADIVTEFFGFSINSILFQRGVYDAASFARAVRWGLSLQVTADPQLTEYLNGVLAQVKSWLEKGEVKKLVLILAHRDTEEVMERWVFNVETDRKAAFGQETVAARSDKEIAAEIGAILRQITSSTSFLPLLDCLCTFDVLVYTPNDIATPGLWEESDARAIPQSAEVHLRSFTTKLHKINTSVAYKLVDFGEA